MYINSETEVKNLSNSYPMFFLSLVLLILFVFFLRDFVASQQTFESQIRSRINCIRLLVRSFCFTGHALFWGSKFKGQPLKILLHKILKDYLLKGYSINEKRLAQKEQEVGLKVSGTDEYLHQSAKKMIKTKSHNR